MTGYFNNPILPGFHPDPSICRVGEDYYMATSSFAYFPGIPLFHSRDLVHWEQIGHVIHRREQLDFDNCQMALGLWAPTLRFHQGRFYLINTFVSEGLHEKRMNYIVTAENPAGPWSDPVVVEGADGIDPSLYFGEDGKMWYIGNFICQPEQYDIMGSICSRSIRRHFSSAASDMFCGTEYRHRENGWRHRIFIIMGTGTI